MYDTTYMCKPKKTNSEKQSGSFQRVGGGEKWENTDQRVNKFWGFNIQPDYYS